MYIYQNHDTELELGSEITRFRFWDNSSKEVAETLSRSSYIEVEETLNRSSYIEVEETLSRSSYIEVNDDFHSILAYLAKTNVWSYEKEVKRKMTEYDEDLSLCDGVLYRWISRKTGFLFMWWCTLQMN
jgi:hypothetical protein